MEISQYIKNENEPWYHVKIYKSRFRNKWKSKISKVK